MLAELAPWQLELVAEAVDPVYLHPGQTAVERNSDDGNTYFLTRGELSLEASNEQVLTLQAGAEAKRMPVANLRPRMFTVTAVDEVRLLRVPDIVLTAAGCVGQGYRPGGISLESDQDKERRQHESRLSFDLYRDLKDDRLVLPSLPDLALRVRRVIDDERNDARAVARLVESDAAMATKLLKAANSAFYGGHSAVDSCSAAVVRLGLKVTRQLVMSFALKDVFKSKQPAVQKRMLTLWKHSSKVAALCFVLARDIDGLEQEEALLIGLVHDVGVIAILNYIGSYPELGGDVEVLEQTITRMRGELGAMILRKWNFSPQVVAAAREAESWQRQHDRPADYTDLLIVAQIHERLRKQQMADLPPFEQMSALHRVLGGEVSPERSVQILHDAKSQLDEMRGVLHR